MRVILRHVISLPCIANVEPNLSCNVQVSFRYRHLPDLYRTYRIPFAHTGLAPFQYLHADTIILPANIFWPSTILLLAHRYLQFTGKYFLARYSLNISRPVPTSYRQISSGPVQFRSHHTGTNISPAITFWPGTILLSSYRYHHLTGKHLLAQYNFTLIILVPSSYWQVSSGPVQFCFQHTGTNILPASKCCPGII